VSFFYLEPATWEKFANTHLLKEVLIKAVKDDYGEYGHTISRITKV
jgi:hypothetical protein